MLIVESQSLDVHHNLAVEEYLMDQAAERGPVLFLWRSDRAVVIGKNQNPWRECRLDRMAAEHVPLARRISGGGTVYHDEGNLNYCIIVDRTAYRQEQVYTLVLQALATFGIRAERSGRSNLSVDGRKFSGNAFCFRKGRALHHGTLLLNAELERLDRYLGAMFSRIETRAIASEPAQVMNLGLGVEELSQALGEAFVVEYGGTEPVCRRNEDFPIDALQPLIDRQKSEDWMYGSTPRFAVEAGGARVEVEHGRVISVEGADGAWLNRPFRDVACSVASRIDGRDASD